MIIKKALVLSVCAGLLATSFLSTTSAHGVWITERLDQKQLVLGEGPGDNAYNPNSVKTIQGYTADLQKTSVKIVDQKNHVVVQPTDETAVISVDFDYGYWTKGADGKIHNEPMNKVNGAVKGTHALKYNVTYLHSVKQIKPIPNIPLQIVPKIDPTTLHKGDDLPIYVLKNGKPLANVEIIPDVINDLTHMIKTDDQGQTVIKVPNNGVNVIGIEIAFPITEKNTLATQNKYFSSLTFTIYPEED